MLDSTLLIVIGGSLSLLFCLLLIAIFLKLPDWVKGMFVMLLIVGTIGAFIYGFFVAEPVDEPIGPPDHEQYR